MKPTDLGGAFGGPSRSDGLGRRLTPDSVSRLPCPSRVGAVMLPASSFDLRLRLSGPKMKRVDVAANAAQPAQTFRRQEFSGVCGQDRPNVVPCGRPSCIDWWR